MGMEHEMQFNHYGRILKRKKCTALHCTARGGHMNREKMEMGENSVYTTRGGREKRERWMHMRIYVCRSDKEEEEEGKKK